MTPTPQPSGVPAATTRSPSFPSRSRSAQCPVSAHSPRSCLSSGRSKPASPRHATATGRTTSPAEVKRRADRRFECMPRGRIAHRLGIRGTGHALADWHAVFAAQKRDGGRSATVNSEQQDSLMASSGIDSGPGNHGSADLSGVSVEQRLSLVRRDSRESHHEGKLEAAAAAREDLGRAVIVNASQLAQDPRERRRSF